jgi:flagellar protein FliS
MSAATAYTAYRAAEIETISQKDLVIRLFQGIERMLVGAREAMVARQLEVAHRQCQRAKGVICELMSTLNFEQGGEIATQLRDLYVFLLSQICEANLYKDAKRLEAIIPIVATLRSAWEEVPVEFANTSSLPAGSEGHVLSLRT